MQHLKFILMIFVWGLSLTSSKSYSQDEGSRYSKQYNFDKVEIEVAEIEKYASEYNRPAENWNYYSIKIYA